jgi:hypothetical protein
MNAMKVNEDFARMAQGFAGCDGGNPHARLWFCGIEPNYKGKNDPPMNKEKLKKYLSLPRGHLHKGVPYWDEKFRKDHDYESWPLDNFIANIVCRVYGNSGNRFHDHKNYMQKYLYSHDGKSFKLNLFPLSCSGTDKKNWTEAHRIVSGIKEQRHYRKWCEGNRFPFLRALPRQYNTDGNGRVIVCFGKTFGPRFRKAFLEPNERKTAHRSLINIRKEEQRIIEVIKPEGNKSLKLLIIPFPSPNSKRIGRIGEEDLPRIASEIERLLNGN